MSIALIIVLSILFIAYTIGIIWLAYTRGKEFGYSNGVRDTRIRCRKANAKTTARGDAEHESR